MICRAAFASAPRLGARWRPLPSRPSRGTASFPHPASSTRKRDQPSHSRSTVWTAGGRLPRQRGACRAAAAEPDEEYEACFVPLITVDNKAFPEFTKLHLEAPEYPGLLRVVSWVLNGMMLRVENAVLKLDDEGFAIHDYWLKDVFGKKLSDSAAEMLADRLGDFIATCRPTPKQLECREFEKDNIKISNVAHDSYTMVTITGEPGGNKPGFLLELASVITGVGLTIHEALVQGCRDCGVPLAHAQPSYDPSQGRLFVFWVTNSKDSSKLEYADALALMYTLQLVLGRSHTQLVAPNLDLVAH